MIGIHGSSAIIVLGQPAEVIALAVRWNRIISSAINCCEMELLSVVLLISCDGWNRDCLS